MTFWRFRPLIAATIASGVSFLWTTANGSTCPPTPTPTTLRIAAPEVGYEWFGGEDLERRCAPAQTDDAPTRQSAPGEAASLEAWLSGPDGSARFWLGRLDIVTESAPRRGFCFTTSTAGWRTMAGQWPAPLRFVDDQDRDGRPEFALWSSLPLGDGGSNLETALVAWIYELDGAVLRLDRDLTRARAAELADAYRTPLATADATISALRREAAEALDALSDAACWPTPQGDQP